MHVVVGDEKTHNKQMDNFCKEKGISTTNLIYIYYKIDMNAFINMVDRVYREMRSYN
jgi:hypothetical protein